MNDKAKIRELHKLDFDIFSAPRAGRGNGVGFIFKNGFPIKNQKALKFKSFEGIEAVILAQKRMKTCLMYRPGIISLKGIRKAISTLRHYFGQNLKIVYAVKLLCQVKLFCVVTLTFILKVIQQMQLNLLT